MAFECQIVSVTRRPVQDGPQLAARLRRKASALGQTLQVVCCRAGREVRSGPKTDLIPMPNLVAHASRPLQPAEEYCHAGSSECDPSARASAVEQGKANRGKATAATKTRLVDSYETPDRRPRSRPRYVQSGNRQQASWLRCRRHPGRGCRCRRVHGGSRNDPAKKKPAASQI